MLFNSTEFLFIFLPPALLGAWISFYFGRSIHLVTVICISVYFYSSSGLFNLMVLFGSVVVNLGFSHVLARSNSKMLLATAVSVNLGVLGWFKYRYFILGIDEGAIIVPLALSFFTFQQIAYLVDIYRKEIQPFTIIEYCYCVTFFPHLIAGPIVRYPVIRKQLDGFSKPHSLERIQMMREGMIWIALGLAKKVLLADTFGAYADLVFDAENPPETIVAIIATLSFSLQIYFDFSAYSEIAVGLGLLLGIRLPINFNSPYRSLNIAEFWRRWHITLGDFLLRYLYIPLGGNRLGPSRTALNVMITMLLAGLWHGAGWNFIMWGGYHGALISLSGLCAGIEARCSNHIVYRGFAISITFVLVSLGWVMFRAPDMNFAIEVYKSIFSFPSIYATSHNLPDTSVSLALLFGLLLVFFAPRVGVVAQQVSRRPFSTMAFSGAIGGLTLVTLVLGNVGSRFVYFQF